MRTPSLLLPILTVCLVSSCGDDESPGGAGGASSTATTTSTSTTTSTGDTTATASTTGSSSTGGLGCIPGDVVCVGTDVVTCRPDGSGYEITTPCADSGAVCLAGACVGACEAAALEGRTDGCVFWIVDLDNETSSFSNPAKEPFGITVQNPGTTVAHVVVSIDHAAPGEVPIESDIATIDVGPGATVVVDLGVRDVDGSAGDENEGTQTTLTTAAFRLESDAPVTVVQHNPLALASSNDASRLFPEHALGTAYRVVGAPTSNPVNLTGMPFVGIPDHASLTVVGTAASTNVTIELATAILGDGETIPATAAGQTLTFVLGPYEVVNLATDGEPGDLAGSRVTSDKPVVVFSSGERVSAPFDPTAFPPPSGETCCTEHVEEQLVPLTAAATRFVVPHSAIRSTGGYVEPDSIRVVADVDGTTVTTNLPAPDDTFVLDAGQSRDIVTDTDVVLSSSAPVVVGQYLASGGYTENAVVGGDPAFVVVAPRDQLVRNHHFSFLPGWGSYSIVVGLPQGAALTIDGEAPVGCTNTPIGMLDGVGWSRIACIVSAGDHVVTSDAPILATGYTYAASAAAAIAGASDFVP